MHLGASVQDGSRPGWPPTHRPRFADLPLSSATLSQRRLFSRDAITHHTTCMTPSLLPGQANRIPCSPDTRDTRCSSDEMDAIYFGPSRPRGHKGLVLRLETKTPRTIVLFHLFRFSITVGSRPVFFYLLWAEHPSHTSPFHYGPSLFRSLFGSLFARVRIGS